MAERRMFSKRIMESAGFLKMPSSSRLLYYDLGIRADDDGIVEGFTVLRMTGATEDDLKILFAKGFVSVLNEDLVTYINSWTEHNKIRADRKVDSIYKDLLVQMIPDVNLLTSKERTDRKKEKNGSGTSQGQPRDGIGQVRLGQVRLGQSSIGQSSSSMNDTCDDDDAIEIFGLCDKLSLDLKISDIKDFIDIYGVIEMRKAVLSVKSATKEITNPIAYLNKVLTNNTQSNQTIVNNVKEVKPNGNFTSRDIKADDDLFGWND